MGTKVRKRRNTADISRLSTHTRLTAWTVYMELIRDGIDPDVAIRKALQDACPPKEDPYYRSFYPNKLRELELWRKHGLWPLSNPKDIEHDTGPHDAVEVASDARDRVLRNGDQSSGFTLLLDADDPDDGDRINTLEFDPVEVAKIIDSYEHAPTLTAAEAIASVEASIPYSMKHECMKPSYENLPGSMEIGAQEPFDFACLPEVETGSLVRQEIEGCQSSVSASYRNYEIPASAGEFEHHNHVTIDQAMLNELLVMLVWWKDNKERLSRPEDQGAHRPDFAHSHLQTKRIRMNAKLWEDAEKVAKEQTEVSGGSLSGLVEYLLWRHLGSQEKHVKK